MSEYIENSTHPSTKDFVLPPVDKFTLATIRDQLTYDPYFIEHHLESLQDSHTELAHQLPIMARILTEHINRGEDVQSALLKMGLAIHEIHEARVRLARHHYDVSGNLEDLLREPPPEAA